MGVVGFEAGVRYVNPDCEVLEAVVGDFNDPAKAKCDGAQSLTPDQFDELMDFIGKEVEFFGKKMN